MIKKEIYPKIKRVICSGAKVEITEKLDGKLAEYFDRENN